MRRSQEGDLDAFNELVDLHQRAVYNLGLRMLGSSHSAEDSTQEAFLSAFKTIRTCRPESFRPWLMRIASNACIDELRRRGRKRALSLEMPVADDETPMDVPDDAPGPEAQALQAERERTIQKALQRLPDDQRLALVLCDLQGFSYAEIAATMRTSIGTVKSRIARGRDKLRVELTSMGEHPSGSRRQD